MDDDVEVPGTRQSGKRDGRRAGLTSYGNAALRAALWMSTLTAVRKDLPIQAYYDRLIANGKLPKVALIAAMHKLLRVIYSVARRRSPFSPNVQPT